MKYKGKAVSGASLLTIIGVVCFATVLATAVVVFVSASAGFGPVHVGTMLTAQERTTTDSAAAALYNPWNGGSALAGTTYTDGLLISRSSTSYTGTNHILVTVVGPSALTITDISMQYHSGDSGSYSPITIAGVTTLTATITGGTATSSSADPYNFEIILASGAPSGTYTITYQAVAG